MKISSVRLSNKALGVLAAVATLPAIALSGVAAADPSGAPTYRKLVGVGSDTTEEVMNGLADAVTINGVKVLGSYNALGGQFDSRDPAALPPTATSCTYTADDAGQAAGPGVRPAGSGNGRNRFLESLTSGNSHQGCLDFSRSSSLNLGSASTQLTYIPFALDAVTYGVRKDSTISRGLTPASLKAIYQCTAGPNFIPLLPQAGSGTRSFFVAQLGLTEATLGSCVRDTWTDPADGLVKSIEEHDGRVLLDKKEIVPYGVAQWAAQSAGVAVDKRGVSVLGNVNGISSFAANVASTFNREVYNVIPTARIGDTANYPELNQVFVGGSSLICAQKAVIGKYALGTVADCGDTSQHTP